MQPAQERRVIRLNRDWMSGLILIAVTFLAYLPSWNGQPIWDDDAHITKPELQSISGLGRIWFDLGATQQYYPLAHSVFWLDESLAVTIGCPLVRIDCGDQSIKDFYLYSTIRGLQEGKWAPLKELGRHPEPEYEDLDVIPVALPGSKHTFVGPLATGRAFCRWLDSTEKLRSFYTAFRDSGSFDQAIRNSIGTNTNEADQMLIQWLRAYDAKRLIE